ncbi:hypothetical protein ABW21_db0200317 [Orbilia brochopaga]|nr:hypothetical protein ABW21_db0200317 [Drechslerella brochopaga]
MSNSLTKFVRYLYSFFQTAIYRLLGFGMSSLGQGFQPQLGQGLQGQGQLGQGFQGQLGQGIRKCYYSAISSGAGEAVALFFRRPDGSIIEAFWRRKQNDYSSFRVVLPAPATPPPNLAIAATLWNNCHYRIYYFDENMNVCEIAFESKTDPVSKKLDGYPVAHANSGLSAVCFHRTGSELRVYYVGSDNKLRVNDTYGADEPLDVSDIHPNTTLQFVTLSAWNDTATKIRGYYQDTSFNICEIAFQDGAWGKSQPVQSAESLIPFAVAATGASGDSPTVQLFTVDDKNEIKELVKKGVDVQTRFQKSLSVVSATGAKSLAAVSNQIIHDSADVHIFSSDDVGDNFVHNWKSDGQLKMAELVVLEQPHARVVPHVAGSMVAVPITVWDQRC